MTDRGRPSRDEAGEEAGLALERFRFLAEFSSDWYWEQDEEYRFTYFARSPQAEARFPTSSSLGKTRWEVPYEGLTDEFWEEHRKLLDARLPFRNLVLKRRSLDGRLIHTSISGAPVYDASGNFRGYRGVGRDVTDRFIASQRQTLEHRITLTLSESNDIDSTIPQILHAICASLDWDLGAYSTLDRRSNTFVRTYSWRRADIDVASFFDASATIHLGADPDIKSDEAGGLIRRAWITREPVWIEDIRRAGHFSRREVAQQAGLNAAFAFRIMVGDTMFGVMDFFRREPCRPDPLLSESLHSISRQVALFLQRKQLEARQSMQNIVTRHLAESTTLDDAMPKIIETVCETLGWDYGGYWHLDAQTASLRRGATWSSQRVDTREFVDRLGQRTIPVAGPEFDSSDSMRSHVWRSRAPVWVADLDTDKHKKHGFSTSRLALRCGLHSMFAFPIMADSQPLGLIEFFSHHIREPDESLIDTARAIGIQIGLFCQRRQAEERVQFLAYRDSLTGLANRVLFNLRLDHTIHQARRQATMLGVLFIDLDRFKNINDTLGHDTGDRLLQEMAIRFRTCLRGADTIARLGGDEFVVLLENLHAPHDAAVVAQKLNKAALQPFATAAGECHVTTSIGISLFPDNGEDEQTLMKHADIAMYQAKASGKNNYRFYSEQINSHSLHRLSLESALRRALERDELLLHYQPRFSLGTGRATGMEALVRWDRPETGMVSPTEFIPIAEEIGLIGDIGRWVLHTACIQAKAWKDGGLPALKLSVNLSARQFSDRSLLKQIADILKTTGLPAQQLELEITESMVMHDPDEAVRTLQEIRAMGIAISMDDFGTGYSSLSQLMRFPINTIKIDRSFIRDVTRTKEHAAITTATIAMSKALGMSVVAEGVEKAEQVEFLKGQQCDEVQGFYFSRPVPADLFARLFRPEATSEPGKAA